MNAISLYVHFPWCVKKCPYCDFNSHGTKGKMLPFDAYIDALIDDLGQDLNKTPHRNIKSIFFGGGTPSLFSARHFERLLAALEKKLDFSENIEITLEANPGTLECGRFNEYKAVGINRISLGVQSFSDVMLKKLGRIHSSEVAKRAIDDIHRADFSHFNLDLMEALPGQSVEEALADLNTALSFSPPHLSWYQLTLEPGTHFYKRPPSLLPQSDLVYEIEEAGRTLIQASGLGRYEISAHAKEGFESVHNLNYWQFGDYLGIGAGAHSKLTDAKSGDIIRASKQKQPKRYLDPDRPYIESSQKVPHNEIALEFMMNHLRLSCGFSLSYFEEVTGLCATHIDKSIAIAKDKGLLVVAADQIQPTPTGRRYLNDLLEIFI